MSLKTTETTCLGTVKFKVKPHQTIPLPDSENTSAKSHGYAHDNAFTDSIDVILAASV
jgi:hypothetical protein